MIFIIVCTIVVLNQLYVAANNEKNALTNADRLNYLKRAGYTVLCDTPTTKIVTIPEIFSRLYNDYNSLQLSVGHDLSLYKGCVVTIYSYIVKSPNGYKGEACANMIVYNNRVIGGDVSSLVYDEYTMPLIAHK